MTPTITEQNQNNVVLRKLNIFYEKSAGFSRISAAKHATKFEKLKNLCKLFTFIYLFRSDESIEW